ncbi:YlbD family protein [Bacillus sp. 165]|uniref:YlbD family protein n=1 Tax=Bacillus sp. 165 TaxID=1529117 RepID=UPI001ADAF5EE|nr:YlbD family protein [Bacillus sp. 165]MBO9130291.1 YlbD family protein [Bacillus sp. 165]
MQTKGNLHPSVQQFKVFVKNHPKMINAVRSGQKTWQQFYEEWYLLGEKDQMWNTYKPDGTPDVKDDAAAAKEGEGAGFVGQMMSFIKKIDMDQIQTHISSVTEAIGSVQQVIQQFQSPNSSGTSQRPQNNPFHFQKD